jgi:glutamyl-Q tRNA(Asp) synthetase
MGGLAATGVTAPMRQRFAPSPTGLLHIGHAFSAVTAWRAAQAANGEFLLRIEDIDQPRCKPEFEQAIFDDLHWLGLSWPEPVMRQSERMPIYAQVLDHLTDMGVCYPCCCTRKDIAAALSAPQEGQEPEFGPDGLIYPGTCSHRAMSDKTDSDAVRLSIARAIDRLGGSAEVERLCYVETGSGTEETIHLSAESLLTGCGDIVLARKDIGTSYHLAVVVDDADQDITHVTRGRDMAPATQIHRLLQALLGLPTPVYHHHRLIRDENGKRLAKRDDARSIRSYREAGLSPIEVLALVGL